MHACRQSLASSAARYQWKPVDPPPQTLIPSLGRETLVDEQMDLVLPVAGRDLHCKTHMCCRTRLRWHSGVCLCLCRIRAIAHMICLLHKWPKQTTALTIKCLRFPPNQPIQKYMRCIALHHSEIAIYSMLQPKAVIFTNIQVYNIYKPYINDPGAQKQS